MENERLTPGTELVGKWTGQPVYVGEYLPHLNGYNSINLVNGKNILIGRNWQFSYSMKVEEAEAA